MTANKEKFPGMIFIASISVYSSSYCVRTIGDHILINTYIMLHAIETNINRGSRYEGKYFNLHFQRAPKSHTLCSTHLITDAGACINICDLISSLKPLIYMVYSKRQVRSDKDEAVKHIF